MSSTPIEKEPTPGVEKNLTYTVVRSSSDSAPIVYETKPTSERGHSSSSGKSFCVKLVDEVVCLSTSEKKDVPSAILVEIEAPSPRSHSRTSESVSILPWSIVGS